jgi:tetratricopeptide (TPR) repeat protein
VAELQEVGELLGRCRALVGLSDVARDQGDAQQVIELCEECLTLLHEAGDVYLTGFVLHNLGYAAWYQGDRDRAERLFDDSLSCFERQRAAVDAVEVRTSIGLLALDRGRYDRASAILAECLATARKSAIRWLIATLLEGMAGVVACQDQAERAALLFGAVEAERRLMDTPRWPARESFQNRWVSIARAALGQERFLQTLEEGRAMPLDQAVAFALHELPVP